MTFLIIDNGSSHLGELVRLCGVSRSTVVPVDGISRYKPGQKDIFVLSGSHIRGVIGNEDYFKPELDLIATTPSPIIGVCLGFELIAYAAGARLERIPRPESGLVEVFPTEEGQNWFPHHQIKVSEAHRWVVKDVPPGYLSLAKSHDGVEAMANLSRRIVGLQFHPEHIAEGSEGARVFSQVVDRIAHE